MLQKISCNEKLRQLYDSGTSYEDLNNDDVYNNQEEDTNPRNNQNHEQSRITFFLETQKIHRESIKNSQDDTHTEKQFDSGSEKGEGHTDNVEKFCENIQGKKNKELEDNNVSVEDTLLETTVNQLNEVRRNH